MEKRYHTLPASFYESIGRLEFIQENWYLSPELSQVIGRVVEILNPMVTEPKLSGQQTIQCVQCALFLKELEDILTEIPLEPDYEGAGRLLNEAIDEIIADAYSGSDIRASFKALKHNLMNLNEVYVNPKE